MAKIIYFGIFFDPKDLPLAGKLNNVICNPHVTFEFLPERVPSNLLGQEVAVTIIGYGNDGQNEGLAVKISDEAAAYYKNDAPPHITLSVSNGAKPVNTKNLEFAKVVEPVVVTGKFGVFTK